MKDLIELKNGKAMTGSLKVAKSFEKEHKNVLRDIENLECSQGFRQLNFEPSNYLNSQGKKQPLYFMTREGFMFLVMGFTGQKAASVKEEFIAAFNAMEKQLIGSTQPQNMLQLMQNSIQILIRQDRELKQINDRINLLEGKIKEYDGDTGYRTIVAYCRENKILLPLNTARSWGIKASKLCRQYGYPVGRVPDERYGHVNSYPIEILKTIIEK